MVLPQPCSPTSRQPDPPPGLNVAIIGAGIAGLTLALGLRRRGVHVTVYERAAHFREEGAGIGFTANAERAMQALEPAIHAAFKRVAVRNADDWFIWVDGTSGREEGAGRRTAGEPDRLIHRMYLGERGFEGCARADFLDQLAALLPVDVVRFEHCLDLVVEDNPAGPLELRFRDGKTAWADVVIGADGIRSRVRRLLFGIDHPASHAGYTHKFAFRGLVDMESARGVLGESKTLTRHMYLGPDGHVLTFPIAGGTLLNVVAFVTDHDAWAAPGKMTSPSTKAEAVAAFSKFGLTVRTIIELLPNEMERWAIFDTCDHPAPTFARGRVCLSGDAAHAAAPYHGAGAGFAVEDALVLAELFSEAARRVESAHGSDSRDICNALNVYSKVRMGRCLWLVESSRMIGRMYEWQDEHVSNDYRKCAQEIEWRSKRIWEYDVSAMLKEASEGFRQRCADQTKHDDI